MIWLPHRPFRFAATLLGLSCATAIGAPSYIEDPPGGPLRLPPVPEVESRFTVRHWTVADGLPRQQITSLAQTPDRYLWCATGDALVRYDGGQFKVFPVGEVPELEGFWIHGLFCDGEGRLWIFGVGGKVAVLEAGRFRRMGVADGLPEGGGNPSVIGDGGECWVSGGGVGEFFRFHEGRFRRVEASGLRELRSDVSGSPLRVARAWAGGGEIRWALMDGPLISSPSGEKIRDAYLVDVGAPAAEKVTPADKGEVLFELSHFFPLANGSPALTSRDGIYDLKEGGWRARQLFDLPLVKTHGGPQQTYHDEVGDYWIGTGYGGLVLCEEDGTTRHFVLPEERRKPNVRAVIGNPADGVWVATDDGLYQIRRRVVESWTRSRGIPEDRVNAVVEGAGGVMWVAVDESVFALARDGSVGEQFEVPLDYRIHGVNIRRLELGRGGELWVGLRRFLKETQGWQHELWRLEDGELRFTIELPGLCTNLHWSDGGSLLVGTTEGLARFDGSKLSAIDLPLSTANGARPVVTAILEDVEGRPVAGVYGHGVYRNEAGGWRALIPNSDGGGLPVISVEAGPDGELWVGAEGAGLGVVRDGRWHSFSPLGDLLPRSVTGALTDGNGGLWLASNSGEGLLRYDREGLLRWIDDPSVTVVGTPFRREDGLPSLLVAPWANSLARDSGGRLWVASFLGVSVIDPAEWHRLNSYARPPVAHIQRVLVNDDGVREFVSGDLVGGAVEVPPGPRRIEFDFSAVEFGSPDSIRYRYRLEGYEDAWIEAGDRTAAVYPDLPPGRYTFRVAVAAGGGDWSEGGSGVGLWIQPKWWERPVTRVLAVLLIVLALTSVFLLKLRQVRRRARRQEEFSRALIRSQEDERKRLANELHDSLGHELLVLKGALERESGESGKEGGGRLREFSTMAAEAVQQVREISHDLRPPELERFGLGPALEAVARSTEAATGIQIAIESGEVGRLSPDLELGLYRIAQEALSNMAKHSDASDGLVSLGGEDGEVVLVIEDDGRGFDSEVLERARGTGGLGLSGIEERARLLGGNVQFVSRRRKGARVIVRVPGRPHQP